MQSRIKSIILSTLMIVLFSSLACAESEFHGLSSIYKPLDRKERQAKAFQWLTCFKKLHEDIPTLSPEEARWIEREYDKEIKKYGTYTRRAMAASDSKEYNSRLALQRLESILPILSILADNKKIEKNLEVAYWAMLASNFMDASFWQSIYHLVELKIIDKNFCNYDCSYKELCFYNFVLKAQNIIDQIIINHLVEKMP